MVKFFIYPPNAGNIFTPGPESPVWCVQANKRRHAGYFDIRHVIKVTALILEFEDNFYCSVMLKGGQKSFRPSEGGVRKVTGS